MRAHAEQRELSSKYPLCPAIGVPDTDDPLLSVSEKKRGFRRHAGGKSERGFRSFDRRQFFLETLDRGIETVPRIEIAGLSALHHIEQLRRRTEGKGGRVVQRCMRRSLRIMHLATVD